MDSCEAMSVNESTFVDDQPSSLGLSRWKWGFLFALNNALLLLGQLAAAILGIFYLDEGGKSKWMAVLVRTVAFPVVYLPLFLLPSPKNFNPVTELPALLFGRSCQYTFSCR